MNQKTLVAVAFAVALGFGLGVSVRPAEAEIKYPRVHRIEHDIQGVGRSDRTAIEALENRLNEIARDGWKLGPGQYPVLLSSGGGRVVAKLSGYYVLLGGGRRTAR